MREIELTRGYVALVDDEDYAELSKHKWYANSNRKGGVIYACRHLPTTDGHRTALKMHRLIMGCAGIVDHIDGNGLNNRRSNLREVSQSENQQNARARTYGNSKFKGVCFHKRRRKWQVYIQVLKVRKHLGYFDNELMAAEAYDKAAIEYFGAFARPNFMVKA